jgi:hypothetical protein
MPWLLDGTGAVRPPYGDDYVLVGRARDIGSRGDRAAKAREDRHRAFADQPLRL